MSDYNGWKNYETWKLALHLDNDPVEWESDNVEDLASEICDYLHDYVDGLGISDYIQDVLVTEFNQIDFKEIATSLLDKE